MDSILEEPSSPTLLLGEVSEVEGLMKTPSYHANEEGIGRLTFVRSWTQVILSSLLACLSTTRSTKNIIIINTQAGTVNRNLQKHATTKELMQKTVARNTPKV